MQIILLTKDTATARVLAVGRRWPLFAGLLLGTLLSAGLFHFGYIYGRDAAQPEIVAVTERTNGRQVPWESTSLTGEFVFNQKHSYINTERL